MKLYYLASPEEVLDDREGLDVAENFWCELSEICSREQFSESGRRSLGRWRMRWRGGSCSVSASSTQACKDAMARK